MAELPADAVARFEVQELHMGFTRIGHITPEALASCRSLKSLSLKSSGLTDLPLFPSCPAQASETEPEGQQTVECCAVHE